MHKPTFQFFDEDSLLGDDTYTPSAQPLLNLTVTVQNDFTVVIVKLEMLDGYVGCSLPAVVVTECESLFVIKTLYVTNQVGGKSV